MVAACVCAWAVLEAMSAGGPRVSEDQSSGVFTPAHPTALAAVRDFLDRHPAQPVQPIAFTHKVHLAKGLKCEACHVGVDTGAEAAIPGVQFCMSCHQVIAKDRPEIKKLAGYKERGEDISWVRVYNYSSSAHVQFNHAPHIRAEVPCSACHGEMGEQTTARRVVNMNMGFCIGCHTQRSVSVDCLTCHF
jgi:hypothetical protein